MPAGCTALTVLQPPVTPFAASFDEQQSDAAPGNYFVNDGDTQLYLRNANASARTITFYADIYGAERTIGTATLPGSGTENGVLILGPFPTGLFNNHSTTESARTGSAMFSHSGADADVMCCPFKRPTNPQP